MKIITKRNLELVVLAAYTFFNFKVLFTFLNRDWLLAISTQAGGSPNLMAIFFGLFLNTALILYWLKKN